jgi:pimeloyl-ACP methyl ester carboxylesterase
VTSPSRSIDSVEREFIGLPSPTQPQAGHGTHPCQGIYWRPKGKAPRIAFIATHYNVDYAEHYLAPFLARRGYGFLGWNTRYRGAEDLFVLEHALIDIGVGVRWLREQAGAEQIVILGNSGGGSLMGTYQSQALALDLDARSNVADALESILPGDFYISVNSHPGRADVLTNWLDPSVLDETDPIPTDPELDMYAPDNRPPFSETFQKRYREAQRERNHRISRWAKGELERLTEAGIPDRVFPLFRVWADLRFMDPAIDPSDRPCPSCYAGDPAMANRMPLNLGRANTLRAWLSMWSLEESKVRVHLQLPKLTEPALVVQGSSDTGCFLSDARAIFESLGSEDKQLEIIPGAHYFEESPTSRDRVSDLLADWVGSRA